MSEKVIETKGDNTSVLVGNFIKSLSEKHNVKPEKLMIGFIYSDYKELYVWDWDAGRSMSEQFKTIEIIDLNV